MTTTACLKDSTLKKTALRNNDGFTQNVWLQVLLCNSNTPEIKISGIFIIYTQSMAANAFLK